MYVGKVVDPSLFHPLEGEGGMPVSIIVTGVIIAADLSDLLLILFGNKSIVSVRVNSTVPITRSFFLKGVI